MAELELHDIQGTVLRNRPMPYYGTYLLLSIEDGAAGRELLTRLVPHITSASDWEAPAEDAWINVVFSCEGLRRLGVPEAILGEFPRPFREGMASRAEVLGDVGQSSPNRWDMPHAGTGLHVGLFVMAGSIEARDRKIAIGAAALDALPGVVLVARLDVGIPPNLREHFGYADGISRPFIEGEGGTPSPGQGLPIKAGEFVLGYENELGRLSTGPGPEVFWKNGTYIAFRKIAQDVALFRQYLRDNADPVGGEELVAAKMMGRWRSGCPLALSPDKDDPELARDKLRHNDFQYADADPLGKLTPVGSHIRRMNPRDGLRDTIVDARIHKVLRRGSAYGPMLPEGATTDDGQARGIMLALINADIERQFEFVQSQWVNDGDFAGQGRRTDPIVGRRDTADDYIYPAAPVRKHLKRLPEFTATRGGEYVFLPGLSALRWLADLKTQVDLAS